MLDNIENVAAQTTSEAVWADVTRVCHRIPPLWNLRNYVAVNPFLGFSSRPLDEAARQIADGLGAQVLPRIDYYRARWKEGSFGLAELAQAAGRSGHDASALEAVLVGRTSAPLRPASIVLTFAERHDRSYGSDWNNAVLSHIARWCAVYLSRGGTDWSVPADSRGLYASWRDAARVDRSLELAGLSGWRGWANALPERPAEAIEAMLARLEVTAAQREPYLYRLLGGLYGWASFLRRSSWEIGSDAPGDLADLVAMRICGDAAVAKLARCTAHAKAGPATPDVEDESVRLVFQDALEDAFTRRLLDKLASQPRPSAARPSIQAVFCIDVRSELMRRHLEAQAEDIQTLGFAGFFGVTLDWQADGTGSARCPVLLKPGVSVGSKSPAPFAAVGGTVKYLQVAPAAAFSFVETLGLAYTLGLAGDAFAAIPTAHSSEGTAPFELGPDSRGRGIPPEGRLDLACFILKNMGLRTSFARLVLLCGHAGRSANNPHAAGLDCGACGGHGGAINARVAAAVLNDPAVRTELPNRGWTVPADTHFLPGNHDTSVDEVTLLDIEQVPAGHRADLDRLRTWLAQAAGLVRGERAAALGLTAEPTGILGRLLNRRARDCSEVRPEWGLARNAAFIAARRERTRGVDLHGRAFLHDYDCTTDPDNSILTLILSAPMVVASWINLQYFASTVDNHVFGCGTKALHNRVGDLGVVLGNGGDLRTGLPIQSVHSPDGRWYHEPLRLQVIVEAESTRIEKVLDAQSGVKELVDNGWVRLFALDPDVDETMRWVPGQGWERVDFNIPYAVNGEKVTVAESP